jgi:hypothetical protein
MSARLLNSYLCLDEFRPSADVLIWLDVSVGVFDFVLLQNFPEVHRFEITGGVDDCAPLHIKRGVVCDCDAFCPHFVVYAFLPEFFPLDFELRDNFVFYGGYAASLLIECRLGGLAGLQIALFIFLLLILPLLIFKCWSMLNTYCCSRTKINFSILRVFGVNARVGVLIGLARVFVV